MPLAFFCFSLLTLTVGFNVAYVLRTIPQNFPNYILTVLLGNEKPTIAWIYWLSAY